MVIQSMNTINKHHTIITLCDTIIRIRTCTCGFLLDHVVIITCLGSARGHKHKQDIMITYPVWLFLHSIVY